MNRFGHCYQRKAENAGFALIVAISLMGFLLLLSISLATLTQVETNASNTGVDSEKARKNAYMGLLAALGELQTAAGPDRRAMATADAMNGVQTGARHWLGVWNSTSASSTPVWLVSGDKPSPTSALSDPVTILGKGILGDNADANDIVLAPRVELEEGAGNFAWWVSDESMKTSIKESWAPDEAMTAYASLGNDYKPDVVKANMARRVPMRRAVEEALPGIEPEGAHATGLKNALNLYQLNGLPSLAGAVGEAFHDVTLVSFGLLTNPVDGGFKYNLTGANSDPYDFLNDSLVAYLNAERRTESGTRNSPYTGSSTFTTGMKRSTKPDGSLYEPEPVLALTPPALNRFKTPMFPPASASKGDGYAFFAPVLTEFLFRLSVLTNRDKNTFLRSDFVYELWNPYPFTMEVTRQADAATLPPFRIFVTGYTSTLKVSLWRSPTEKVDEFEIDMNGMGSQLAQNLAMLPYIERFNPNSGTASPAPAIMYPGEVYAGRSPYYHWDPSSNFDSIMQRQVAGPKWFYTENAADLLEPQPEGGIWMHANDMVSVEVDGSFDLSILSEPYSQNMQYDGTDLTDVQIQIRGIPFSVKLEDMPVSGNPQRYYYETTGEHGRNRYQMAVRLRLKDSLDDLNKLAERMDPRKRVVDWSEIADIYELSTFGLGTNPAFTSLDQNDLFRHDSDETSLGPESYRYSTYQSFLENSRFVKLFDVPTFAPVSLDVFRSAYFVDMPAFSFGEPQSGSAGSTLNAAFDRYFMTGITDEWKPVVTDGKPEATLPNPNLHFPDWNKEAVADQAALLNLLKEQGAAQQLLVAGSFDINSTSVAAWAAALASPQYVMDDLKTPRVGVILHMPHQPLTDADIASARTDSQLAGLVGNDFRNAVFTQTVRVLDNPTQATDSSILYSLAEEIVKGIREWQKDKGRPFYSMEEFANSGVIKEALSESGINTIGGKDIPALSPLYISQSKIMGLLSNFATVRGDTFLIRAYGDVIDPATNAVRSSAMCEAIVQRMPDFVNSGNAPDASTGSLNAENQRFGRRFHIVAFTWVDTAGR